MRKEGKGYTGIAALLVLAVFAVGILSVLLGGAGIYERLTRRDQCAFQRRTAAQYLATKVRQSEGTPQVEKFSGTDALVLSQVIDGKVYVTRIYCWDGWLRELFTAADGAFSPEDGEKILPMAELSVSVEQKIFALTLREADGTETALRFACRLGQEEQP